MIKNCFSNVDNESLIKKIDVEKLENINNYFEVTYGDRPSRVFIDIDGDLDIDFIKSEMKFDDLNNNIIQKLMTIDNISLLSSSNYKSQKRDAKGLKEVLPKLSYRITYINEYCNNINDVKQIVINEKMPLIKNLLKDIIEVSSDKDENTLNIDMSVYRNGRGKMRCANAYKYDEEPNRINRLLKGEVEDTIISLIPKNCNLKEFKVIEKDIKKDMKVEKVEKKVEIKEDFNNNDILDKILDNLDIKRLNNYDDWFKIACIFVNEGYDLSIFDKYSKKSPKYNKSSNDNLLRTLKKNCNGYKIATLYFMLKEDNYSVWKELQSKRKDFWEIMEKFNHTDIAQLFFNMYPNKYIYSKKIWYELNEFNIYKEVDDYKNTLFNNLSLAIQNFIIEQRNLIIPSDEQYMNKNKMVKNNYNAIGNSNFKKGVIESLCGFYYKEDAEFNTKQNLIAFKNKVYDVETGQFRDIKPEDYISISTKYEAPEKSDPVYRKKINKILNSIFEDDIIVNYWLTTVSLSLFTNKFESMYIHTGGGRNGKGVMGDILSKALGEYYQQANSDLLTGEIKSATNPTLANSRYCRLLVLSEPDDSGKDYKLKTSLVKSLTGGDIITVRDLYKSNISYKPMFSIILQCNKKPAIDKIDKAIEERLKVIHYPFTFVDNPTETNERQRDYSLKDSINNDIKFIQEFMLLLLETAFINYKNKKIEIPQKVKDKNEEYFNENNPVKEFLKDKFDITNKDTDKIKGSIIYEMYNLDDNYIRMSHIKFAEAMVSNNIKKVKLGDGIYYLGLKQKPIIKEKEDDKVDFIDM